MADVVNAVASVPNPGEALYLIDAGEGESPRYLICQTIAVFEPSPQLITDAQIEAFFETSLKANPLPGVVPFNGGTVKPR